MERIPVIDKKTGQQKVDKRNRKQWKCHTADSIGWNSKENAKMWRKDLADTINAPPMSSWGLRYIGNTALLRNRELTESRQFISGRLPTL
jgi:hypothetical protein